MTEWSDVFERFRQLCPTLRPDQVVIERRGDRAMARLPGDRIGWVAVTPAAAELLRAENRVLDLIGGRCSFCVPAVLATSGDDCTIRSVVPGHVDPEGLAARLKSDPALIPGTSQALASILAEQHTRIGEADVAGWLQTVPQWPMPRATIVEILPAVCDDVELRRRVERLLDAYDDVGTEPRDRALVHTDLGLHNVAFDPVTGAINGVFDYGDAAWADRHLDFRYLVFGAVQDALLDATIAAYEGTTGLRLDRRRVLLCNAAAAASHLADRAGRGPDDVVAGRTLAGDLRWTRWALGRAGC